MSTPDVSAVIVAWNAGESLDRCLTSLRRSAGHAGVELEVVIVDNASADGSVDGVRRAPDVVVVGNPVNAGYGVAAAQGLARARADWALLVNTDVEVSTEFFTELVGAARKAAGDVASIVPELRYASDPSIVNSRGVAVDTLGVPLEVDLGSPHSTSPTTPTLGGSSGCCLLRLEAVRQLGGPEPVFFAYLEDVDLAVRLCRAGYRALFVPSAHALHVGSASLGGDSPLKAYLVARNRRLLFALAGPGSVAARLARVPIEIGHGIVTSASGAGLAPWRGRLAALRARRYVRFVKRSRSLLEPRTASLPELPAADPLGALRRKRAARRSMQIGRDR